MGRETEGADAGEVVAPVTRPLAIGEEEPLVDGSVYLGPDCRPRRAVHVVEDAHGDERVERGDRLPLGPGRV